MELMKEDHCISMHQVTVPNDIDPLKAVGFEIIPEWKQAWNYYLSDRTFSLLELKLLVDAVESSKYITEKLRPNTHITGRIKPVNEKGYYIVDAINEVLNIRKKISFLYFNYSGCKRQVLKNDGENSVMKAIIDYFGKNAKTRVVDKEGFRAAVRVCVRDEDLNKNKYVNSFYYAVTRNPSLNKQLDALQAEYDQIKHAKGIGSPRIIVIRKEISKIRSQIWEQECCYVSDVSIVATTISKVVIDKLFQEKKYDVVMFDEVSMAYVLQVVCAATFAKEHMICVGDFMQLTPIAQSKVRLWQPSFLKSRQ